MPRASNFGRIALIRGIPAICAVLAPSCAAIALALIVSSFAKATDLAPACTVCDSLAFSAAMEGRKAATLAAVAGMAQGTPPGKELAGGSSGWNLTAQYAALIRFGLWDEMLAVLPPDARARGLTAGYLYGRGVALAARGRLGEAQETLGALRALAAGLPEDSRELHGVVSVAEPIVAARIAASAGRNDEAIVLLSRAVEAEDRLSNNEHVGWFFPARHLLGAQLLIAGEARRAERTYREDLARNPGNGWSLYGLAAALRAEGRSSDAARVQAQFERAWQHADVQLPGSAFWLAGPDTRSCECQRPVSAERQKRREPLHAQHEAGVH